MTFKLQFTDKLYRSLFKGNIALNAFVNRKEKNIPSHTQRGLYFTLTHK